MFINNDLQKHASEKSRETALYQALLHDMDDRNVTVLEAELTSGHFRLIYNSNPDYAVKMPESPFEEFAMFFGVDQIHPDDREEYLKELHFCHGPFFEQGLRRHSVFCRMLRPSTGEYRLHEFVTLRMEMGDDRERSVILICRPVETAQPEQESASAQQLEAELIRQQGQNARQLREQALERSGLLQVAQITFPEIVNINLTQRTYRMVRYFGDEAPEMLLEGDLQQMLELRAASVIPEEQQAFRDTFFPERLEEAAQQGKKQVQLTYRRSGEDGACHWVETTLMRQDNPYDEDILIVAVSRNVDDEKEQEIRLQEKIRLQAEEMALTMRQMGKHISYYDVVTGTRTTSPVTAEQFGILPVLENYPECHLENPPPGYSREDGEKLRLFFASIRRGDPTGTYDYSYRTPDGQTIWLRREFHNIFDDRGRPVRAVLTSEDVTARYEQIQQQESDYQGLLKITRLMYPEILSLNLTQNTCEVIQGMQGPAASSDMDLLVSVAAERVAPEYRAGFVKHLSRQSMLQGIERGEERFRYVYLEDIPDDGWHWIETIALRHKNPYSDDVLVFAASRIVDDEKEREARLEELIRQREEELRLTMTRMGSHISYYDIATGTLTTLPQSAKIFGIPTVMENYPESFLADPPAGYPISTGEILREFIGAIRRGEPTGACDYPTVSADGRRIWLHREFATIFDNQGKPVRAVITSEDVTEQYVQARQEKTDYEGLIKITHLMFPQILSCNLTKNTCEVIQSVSSTPQTFSLDAFLNIAVAEIMPEDQEAFRLQFFRENQLKAIAEGKQRFQLIYRRKNEMGGWNWIETTALHHVSLYSDDILTFAVSRNVDRQKAQEERLQQALAESTDKMEGWLYYDGLINQNYSGMAYVNYDDDRSSPYFSGDLAKRLDCPEKELVLGTCFRIPKEDEGLLQRACEESRRAGKTAFQADYRIVTDRGETIWVHNQATRFTDKNGDTGYIHFLSDITRERELLERLKIQMEERLKAQEQVFDIVSQHSNRILYAYDLAAGTTRPWNTEQGAKDALGHLYKGVYSSEEGVKNNEAVMPESAADTERFFANIHAGVPSGDLNIHIRMEDGALRWYHFRYSTIFDNGKPVTALISAEDITERHEHEMAHLRHVRSMEDRAENHLVYTEICLTCGRVEKLNGMLFSEEEKHGNYSISEFHRLLVEDKFRIEEAGDFICLAGEGGLLRIYESGSQSISNDFKAGFADGISRWLRMEVMMMPDPFNGHIKAFIHVVDITDEQEERLSIQKQAEQDAMTGLLRRGVGERHIRKYMSERAQPGGILLILDLDDLKGINDKLGHQCGDAAIKGIAETIKRHFRKDDVLIRAGGDEFMVFLPGAGKSVNSVELSITALLRKLAAVSLGDGSGRAIHCSVGCAVELPDTDTFDSLYQRADMALYHVKRSGKNNFAFFEPAMLEESYRFRVKQAVPVVINAAEEGVLQGLLAVISSEYPGVVRMNLTQDYFQIMSVGNNVSDVHAPDHVDVFWKNWRNNIHPDDWENTFSVLSRNALLAAFARGQRRFSHYYRNKEAVGYVKTQVDVRFHTEANGDIAAFLFFRWDTAGGEKDVEIRRLTKLLEMTDTQNFEYVCLVDVRSKEYSVFRDDGENSHLVPETADFDTATRHIRDTQIPPEEQDAYYEKAALASVLAGMERGNGTYSYRYTMLDGAEREVVFGWYEDNHAELLMTVRKL